MGIMPPFSPSLVILLCISAFPPPLSCFSQLSLPYILWWPALFSHSKTPGDHYQINSNLSGLAWHNNLTTSQQRSSISSCSQTRSLLFIPAGSFTESLLFPHLPPFVRPIPPTLWFCFLHEVFCDHSWKRILFIFLDKGTPVSFDPLYTFLT